MFSLITFISSYTALSIVISFECKYVINILHIPPPRVKYLEMLL